MPTHINGPAIIFALTFLFLSALGLNLALYSMIPMAFWSVVALFLFVFFICALAKFAPVPFILLLPYIFFRLTTLVSGIAIEHQGYLAEFQIMGEATGATIRVTMIYILFISVAASVIEYIYRKLNFTHDNLNFIRQRTASHPWVWIFYSLFILFSIYMVALGLTKGFPLITGMDRFIFRDEVGGRLFLLYMGNRSFLAFLFGLIIFLTKGAKQTSGIVLFITLIVISVLYGEKFTSLITLSINVITPAYILSKILQEKILTQVLPALAGMAIMTLPLILIVYGWNDNPTEALEKLQNRVVGQSQIWYVADRDTDYAVRFDGGEVGHILSSLISTNPNKIAESHPYIGIHYFSNNYMEPGLLRLFTERPSLSLTLGLEGYLLVLFGWLGMIIPLFIVGITFAVGRSYLLWSILQGRPISIFLAGKLAIWMNFAVQQGVFHMMFGIKTLAFIGIIVIYELISSMLSKNNTPRRVESDV